MEINKKILVNMIFKTHLEDIPMTTTGAEDVFGIRDSTGVRIKSLLVNPIKFMIGSHHSILNQITDETDNV